MMVLGIGIFLWVAYLCIIWMAASIAVPSVRNDDGVMHGTGAAPRERRTLLGVDMCHALVVVDPSVPMTIPVGSRKAVVMRCSGEMRSM